MAVYRFSRYLSFLLWLAFFSSPPTYAAMQVDSLLYTAREYTVRGEYTEAEALLRHFLLSGKQLGVLNKDEARLRLAQVNIERGQLDSARQILEGIPAPSAGYPARLTCLHYLVKGNFYLE